MRRLAVLVVAAGLALAAAAAPALAASPCPQEFYQGREPVLAQPAPEVRELCFHEFAVLHSGVDREPLWSAEHLTAAQVKGAVGGRVDKFHPEPQLPAAERAELADYTGEKGFDRGHMSPVGDMDTPAAKAESFTLANMVPQSSTLNEGLWAGIEAQVRGLAQRDGEVWVVTGPVFGAHPATLKGRVAVPASTWKAVFDAKLGAGAYVATNDPNGAWKIVSVSALIQLTGIDPFPGLPVAVKAKAAALPPPDPKSIHKAPTTQVAAAR